MPRPASSWWAAQGFEAIRRAEELAPRTCAPRTVDMQQPKTYAPHSFYQFPAKGGERVKKFAIRQVETVKTTAAFYDCKICLPLCEIWLPN